MDLVVVAFRQVAAFFAIVTLLRILTGYSSTAACCRLSDRPVCMLSSLDGGFLSCSVVCHAVQH